MTNEDIIRGSNFLPGEFRCRCSNCTLGLEQMAPSLLTTLVQLRKLVGSPLVITSAIRCNAHNIRVQGAKTSAHLTGHAVDISCTSNHLRWQIVTRALELGVTRIGIYQRFVHIDVKPSAPQEVIWNR